MSRVRLLAVPVALLALAAAAGAASPVSPSPVPPPAVAASPSPSPSASPDAQQQLLEQVRVKLGASLAAALTAQEQLAQALQQNSQQQDALSAQLATTSAVVERLDAAIAARQQQIDGTQARIAAEREAIGALARAVYVQPSNPLLRLLQSGSLSDVLTGTADLVAAGQRSAELQAALAADLRTLQADQAAQQADRQQQAALLTTQQQSLLALQQLQAQEQQTTASLQASIAKMTAALQTLGRQQADLTAQLDQQLETEQAQLVGAAEREAWTQAEIWLQSNQVGVTPSAGHSTQSRLIWPLPHAVISQPFGPTSFSAEPPYGGFPHFHTGIDLVEPLGSPVLAADDGVVALAQSGNTGYGNFVVIAHAGGMETLYGHLETILVEPGQQVTQGEPIGLEGSTGMSTGPHTHFEVRVDGEPVDPTPFLPAGPPSPTRT